MFSMFKKSPAAKLEKEIMRKMTVSVQLQRSGKIREFAEASRKISELQEQLEALEATGQS